MIHLCTHTHLACTICHLFYRFETIQKFLSHVLHVFSSPSTRWLTHLPPSRTYHSHILVSLCLCLQSHCFKIWLGWDHFSKHAALYCCRRFDLRLTKLSFAQRLCNNFSAVFFSIRSSFDCKFVSGKEDGKSDCRLHPSPRWRQSVFFPASVFELHIFFSIWSSPQDRHTHRHR